MTLQVSEIMPEVSRSLEIYWDLDNLLDQVTNGVSNYTELDQSLRDAFATGRNKYIKHSRKLEKNALLYAAHILDPRYRTEIIKDIMPDQKGEIIQAATEHLCKEWPILLELDAKEADPFADSPIPSVCPAVQPANMSFGCFQISPEKEGSHCSSQSYPSYKIASPLD